MRWTIIFRYVGISLLMVSALMMVSAGISIANGCDEGLFPLLYSAFITLIVGIYPMIFVRAEKEVSLKEGYHIVVLSWALACLFGMLPYLCYGNEFDFINSLFESVSGFTTTGASILNDIESLPMGLQFWRMSTAWVGGIGIVTLFSLMIPRRHDRQSVLSGAELSSITRNQAGFKSTSFVKIILSIYTGMTLLCYTSLRIAGMEWFDAITNSMSACSTCGFCVKNASIAAYNSIAVEIILTIFMILSGISFVQIYLLISRGQRDNKIRYEVILAYLLTIIVATAIVFIDLESHDVCASKTDALRKAAFQVSSIITTTGFATTDTNTWPPVSTIVILALSMVCACSGSTAGGIKMDRVVIMAKSSVQEIFQLRNPYGVKNVKVNGKIISENTQKTVLTFFSLYIALIGISSLINVTCGLDLRTGISASIACIGNVGPGFGAVGSVCNYDTLPVFLKMSSMAMMLLGRLEILPILYVLRVFRL